MKLFNPNKVPVSVCTDSYKQSHCTQYPEARTMSAYIEARKPMLASDHRVVNYGVRYFVERWLMRQWTLDDVTEAERFFSTFNAGSTPHPFPRDLFIQFIEENEGYFPVKVRALPDGTACRVHTPQLIIEANGDYARLVTWLESLALQTIWYMSTVATLSRMVVTDIAEAFERSADEDAFWAIASRFHDFGFRGCTSMEQSIMGGSAHLLSSDGTDTTTAAYYVQYHCNEGRGVGRSIPATEHSVMTSYKNEADALKMMVDQFGNGAFATVADSYDYENFINTIVPQFSKRVQEMGGFHVVRPDSGDPVECVVQGLVALEKAYGSDTNSKGYNVIRGAGVIQGDGITPVNVRQILEATMEAGFSAQNVAFGMGGGLLQRVDRDTLGYAMKLSYVVDADGTPRNIMKDPKTDIHKRSLPGQLDVVCVNGIPSAIPLPIMPRGDGAGSMMKVVWDSGPPEGFEFENFDQVRARLNASWSKLPKQGTGVSDALRDLQERVSASK